ncbi:MAG: hypothetical protein R3E95_22935 [Thiolinea sp.]
MLEHSLQVQPDPVSGTLKVLDTLRLPEATAATTLEFSLNRAFSVQQDGQPLQPIQQHAAVNVYRARSDANGQVNLEYSGKLASTPDCDWLVQACVLLNQQGLFLDGGSAWYPQAGDALHRFRLQVVLPEGWVSLSQGTQIEQGWTEQQPQRALYLLAGPFQIYEAPATEGCRAPWSTCNSPIRSWLSVI